MTGIETLAAGLLVLLAIYYVWFTILPPRPQDQSSDARLYGLPENEEPTEAPTKRGAELLRFMVDQEGRITWTMIRDAGFQRSTAWGLVSRRLVDYALDGKGLVITEAGRRAVA